MPTNDRDIGKLEGLVAGMSSRFDAFISETNRRWEEHQKMMDDRFKDQGIRSQGIEKSVDELRQDLEKLAGELTQHKLECHRRGGQMPDWMRHPAVKYGGVGIGSAGVVQVFHWFLDVVRVAPK